MDGGCFVLIASQDALAFRVEVDVQTHVLRVLRQGAGELGELKVKWSTEQGRLR